MTPFTSFKGIKQLPLCLQLPESAQLPDNAYIPRVDGKGAYIPHRHANRTWEMPFLTFEKYKCYLAAFFALLGGSTVNPIKPKP